jgi:queuine tRNA-ribosyltransferase
MVCANQHGSDIIMALDDVVSSVADDPTLFEVATYRTLRWLDQCHSAHRRKHDQNLFPIVQGGLDVRRGGLRDVCLAGFKLYDYQPLEDWPAANPKMTFGKSLVIAVGRC